MGSSRDQGPWPSHQTQEAALATAPVRLCLLLGLFKSQACYIMLEGQIRIPTAPDPYQFCVSPFDSAVASFPPSWKDHQVSFFIFAWPTPSSPTSYYRQYNLSDPSERSRFEGFSSLFANLWPLNKACAVLLTWVS